MTKEDVESSAAKAIRDGWRAVLKKNEILRTKIRAGLDVNDNSYDGELDQAWFESQNGTVDFVCGIQLFSYEESERCCKDFVRDPSQPAVVTNRTIGRPVGITDKGDFIILARTGRSALYGKIIRITKEQAAGIRIVGHFNVVLPYDPLSVVVDSAGKWIRTTFGISKET